MSPQRWQQVNELFLEAARVAPDERRAWLDQHCGTDGELRGEVERLLAVDATATAPFLEPAPLNVREQLDREGDAPTGAAPAAGVHIEGYQIVRELGRGGQGAVFQAIQLSTKRKVALKVLLEGAYASPATRRRFEREVDLAVSLKHANIIAILDSGVTDDSRPYYVMDYVRGKPLHHHVRDHRLPLDEMLRLFRKVCEAVQYAHQRGVIHRDLKPSNILVDAQGEPRILDFGLAKQLAASEAALLSISQNIMGTLPYMSPEQTRGNPDEIDTRTDVYALGVILYELLTGRYPYPVVGQMADVLRHIAETPPTPPSRAWTPESGVMRRAPGKRPSGALLRTWLRRASRSPIDDDLQTIVLKALAKERGRRYDNAGALARDIENRLAGRPIDAKSDSVWYVLRKMARQHAYATSVLALLLVILVSSSFINYYFYRNAERNRQQLAGAHEQLRQRNQELELAVNARFPVERFGALMWFLGEWRAGRIELARRIRDRVRPDTPEHAAISFLLDETVADADFLASFPAEFAAMGWLAVGERALAAGRTADATRAFENGLVARGAKEIKDGLLARLEQLRAVGSDAPRPTP